MKTKNITFSEQRQNEHP